MKNNAPRQNSLVFTPPGPVIKRFMESEAFFRSIMGPFGSAKSSACVAEIMRRATYFPPGHDGIRRPRWAIVRNTFPDLRSTTMETWFKWVPRHYGKVSWAAPVSHVVKADGLEMEVLFLALDRDDDVRKLMSIDLTGIWFNEVRYITKGIADAGTGRVGRWVPYPAALNAWAGVIADTNPPDTEHWLYKLAEEKDSVILEQTKKLETDLRKMGALREGQPLYEFFKQPSGLSPEAENIQNLRKGYYHFLAANKSEDWVKVYVHGEYGFVVEGKPVYPMFRDSTHTTTETLKPVDGLPILVGADFGLTPSAVFGQRLPDGKWIIFAELVTDNCGPTRFSEVISAFVATNYPNFKIGGAWGDPAGTAGEEGETYFDILKSKTGWKWKPAQTNDPELRQEAVKNALNRMIDGKPGFALSPNCMTLRKGFASGYHFKFVQSSNGAQIHETPMKNGYSHPHDALQYLMLGGGEYEIVHQKDPNRPKRHTRIADGVNFDPFDTGEKNEDSSFTTEAGMIAWRENRGKRTQKFADGIGEDTW